VSQNNSRTYYVSRSNEHSPVSLYIDTMYGKLSWYMYAVRDWIMKGHLVSLEYSKVRVRRHTGRQKGYMLGGSSVQDGRCLSRERPRWGN